MRLLRQQQEPHGHGHGHGHDNDPLLPREREQLREEQRNAFQQDVAQIRAMMRDQNPHPQPQPQPQRQESRRGDHVNIIHDEEDPQQGEEIQVQEPVPPHRPQLVPQNHSQPQAPLIPNGNGTMLHNGHGRGHGRGSGQGRRRNQISARFLNSSDDEQIGPNANGNANGNGAFHGQERNWLAAPAPGQHRAPRLGSDFQAVLPMPGEN